MLLRGITFFPVSEYLKYVFIMLYVSYLGKNLLILGF